jgi:hypothetical protein
VMTPEAKKALSTTIRALRDRLLTDLRNAAESTFRLSLPPDAAGLPEAAQVRRARLEDQIAEQLRAEATRTGRSEDKLRAAGVADRLLTDVLTEAASTWINRLVLLRLLEASGQRSPQVLTGGWESRGYKDFRELAPALVHDDPSEGYAWLLQLIFEDLSTELPGLFGDHALHAIVPMPPATLRHLVQALDQPALASCWTDDMTLGWVYQYFNDPAREALDDKLADGGKVAPHEIASKTQMFTERYMVDWLLQNSLGPLWLAICARHRWTPDAVSTGTLHTLEQRRVAWREQREAGLVSLTDLMPLHTPLEQRWAYHVPQPLPADAVRTAPASIRDLRLLDPAVGSGHFLVVAFDLLLPLYQEEARHRGEVDHPRWSTEAIVQRILAHNLAGIDLDPRAVQIAAAALWMKARAAAPTAELERMNLVASRLSLGSLPADDPALIELRQQVAADTGIPAELTDTVVHALKGADHTGSLLRVDHAVEAALTEAASTFADAAPRAPRLPFGGEALLTRTEAKSTLEARLESFLARHTSGADLGLRLRGEQLAAGVRFLRLVREGQYDLVVGNPPYQGTAKMEDADYVQQHYPLGKADLYAAFLVRGLELVREGGTSALLTMRNWMFIKQYAELREWLLETSDLRALHDLSSGAFEEISAAQVVVSVAASVFRRSKAHDPAVAMRVFDEATVLQVGETERKRAATLCGFGRHEFDPAALRVVPEWPVVYWWDAPMLSAYSSLPKLGDKEKVRQGLATSNDRRFLRNPWEGGPPVRSTWVPFVKGASGRSWFEPVSETIDWRHQGLAVKTYAEFLYGSYTRTIKNEEFYFRRGIAFSMIGSEFTGRIHSVPGVFGHKGSSVFPDTFAETVCLMNCSRSRQILSSLNPGTGFEVGDVNRLPVFVVSSASTILERVQSAFTLHESHREPSVEFLHPGPSPWRHAQAWAQLAVDRPADAPLPAYTEVLDPEPTTDHLSYALGVALGRFGPAGTGLLDPATDDLSHALPDGLCFLDGSLDPTDARDSLGHPAAAPLHAAWAEHGEGIAATDLRTWLRLSFFKDVHKPMYEGRPIHFPLSSAKKTFVAWVTIHRWGPETLRRLLAEHLHPARSRLEGELTDLRSTRDGGDPKAARAAEQRFAKVIKWHEELVGLIALTEQCAESGPPPADPNPKKCPPREVDARYLPDLDDGVMINSAALWPLLEPQWKEPRGWWQELCAASGRKDYDWSHLAMRFFPSRVDRKCQDDPSLAVAHGCFWRYHPARAWAWELRLQDEIDPDFRITEAPYRGDQGDGPHRAAWLASSPEEALQAVDKEVRRRLKKAELPASGLRMPDPGLWTAAPDRCWALEVQLSADLDRAFLLDAPDAREAREEFLRERSEEAVSLVLETVQSARKRGRISRLHLPGPGLWTVDPERCWAFEVLLTNLQGAPFLLIADDAEASAARWVAEHPDHALELVARQVEQLATRGGAPLGLFLLPRAGLWAADPVGCRRFEEASGWRLREARAGLAEAEV